MKKYKISLLLMYLLILLFSSCTDLDPQLYDRLDASNFYKTREEIEAGLANVYFKLEDIHQWRYTWSLQELTTDHAIMPTRSDGGWYDGRVWIDMHLRDWDATNKYVVRTYSKFYSVIASANSFIEILNLANDKNLAPNIAEIKTLRAWSYFNLVDLFGNVPIVTKSHLDPKKLPTNASRKEVFQFIETELKEAIADLPSVNSVDRASYYPRITKEAAQTILAKLYLNAEVFSGTARWQDCIDVCDAVINSGGYRLTPSIWDSYTPENENSPEIIFSVPQNNKDIDGNVINLFGLNPALQTLFGIDAGWGGASVCIEHYNLYEPEDFRRTLILKGPMYYPDGSPVLDGHGIPFVIIPVANIFNAASNEGLESIKYQPDPKQIGGNARNDMVLLRYADVLLSKAECLFRLGKATEAEKLINQVRARNFNPVKPLTNITLDDILAERSKEFLWDCMYRQDLIRFGKFLNEQYQFKPKPLTESYRALFPIPLVEIQANPNLVQNPGY